MTQSVKADEPKLGSSGSERKPSLPDAARFQRIIASAPWGMHMWDLGDDGKLIFGGSNPAADRILGIKHKDLVGMTIEEAFPSLSRGEIPRIYAEVARTGKDWHTEQVHYEDKRIKGAYEVYAFQTSPGHMVAAFHDITSRANAEEALRRSEERLDLALKGSQQGVWDWNVATDEVWYSPRWKEMLGYSEDEIEPDISAWDRLLHPDDRASAHEAVQAVLKGEREFNLEFRLRHKDGHYVEILSRGFPIRKDGGPIERIVGIHLDLTDRKRVEEEVRDALATAIEEKERLSALINSMTDEVWFASPDRQFRLANPSAVSEFALAVGESTDVEGLAKRLEVRYPDGRERPVEEAPPLRALGGEIVKDQLEIVRTPARGELRYRRVSAAPVRNADGKIIGSVSVVRDVTDQINAEKALESNINALEKSKNELESSKNRLEAIVTSMPVGVFITDTNGKTQVFNDALMKIWGGDAPLPQDFNGFEKFKAFWTDDGREVRPEDWPLSVAIQDGRIPKERIFDIQRFDGTKGAIICTATPLRDAGGKVIAGISYAQDISNQRRAEQLEREEKDKLQFILDSLPVGVSMADATGRTVLRNKRVEELLGGPLAASDSIKDYAQYVGRVAGEAEFMKPEDWPMARSIRKGETIENQEIEFDRGVGGSSTIIVSSVPVKDAEGKITGGLAAFMDITKQKQVERDLARSNTELQSFAYAASHDLREPLRTISGFLELLELDYSEELDDKAKDYIERAVSASVRMHRMIDDILTFSRLETRRKEFGPVDLNEVIRSVMHDLDRTIKDNSATVSVQELPTVWGDESQLAIVLRNLIENGIKFHREDAPAVEVSARYDRSEWIISVKDNGIGIGHENLTKIFNMFVRLQSYKQYPGTGIGLAMCRKIVERHGGGITVESEVGKGSTFAFSLPERRYGRRLQVTSPPPDPQRR